MSAAVDADGVALSVGDTVECAVPGCPCEPGARKVLTTELLLRWAAVPGLVSTFRLVAKAVTP